MKRIWYYISWHKCGSPITRCFSSEAQRDEYEKHIKSNNVYIAKWEEEVV